MNKQNEVITWHRVTEYNSWEKETWRHYFIDGEGVLDVLKRAVFVSRDFLQRVDTLQLSWDAAEALANIQPEYTWPHWFGKLTKIEELKQATADELYKAKIRDFGEELVKFR